MNSFDNHICPICIGVFTNKGAFDSHICEQAISTNYSHITIEMLIPIIITQQQQIRTLQSQIYPCKRIPKQPKTNKSSIEQKIVEFKQNDAPELSFNLWYQTVTPTEAHLSKLFEYDLSAAIQNLLQTGVNTNLPIILVRNSKAEHIYIYTENIEGEDLRWRKMIKNEHLNKWILFLSRNFTKAYLEWRIKTYPDDDDMTEAEFNLDIEYSNRIRYSNFTEMGKAEIIKNIKRFIIHKLAAQNSFISMEN